MKIGDRVKLNGKEYTIKSMSGNIVLITAYHDIRVCQLADVKAVKTKKAPAK